MSNRTRQLISTALITSVLSILIGGFAVVSTYRSEIAIIDKHLNQVESDIRVNPLDAVSIALLSIEQNNFDLTLGFATPTGEVTILRESVGTPLDGPDLRIRHVPIPEGDELIIASSLVDINRSLDLNLWKLLIFIILANILASIATSLLSRSGALAQERAQRQKMQEFLGDAAHELRTPMTVVKGYAELLKGKQLDPERESAAFDRLNSELKRMDFLIGDLLMLAQLGEEGNIDFESIDLAELVRENISDFKEIAPTHPLTTQIDENVVLIGSEKYLRRFIQNALTNIRLHTPASTPVRVSIKADKQIIMIIEDAGPGLPAESYGEKIRGLKRFDRSRSRDTGGTGLGMSIMNAVIERHKGTFTLRKSELGGLAIEVHLPRT
ncbi:MAG: ATP-binding protein [Actinomycetes bacterium]|jgi:signal transduction histidine kinase